jgi:hypothetical protein
VNVEHAARPRRQERARHGRLRFLRDNLQRKEDGEKRAELHAHRVPRPQTGIAAAIKAVAEN